MEWKKWVGNQKFKKGSMLCKGAGALKTSAVTSLQTRGLSKFNLQSDYWIHGIKILKIFRCTPTNHGTQHIPISQTTLDGLSRLCRQRRWHFMWTFRKYLVQSTGVKLAKFESTGISSSFINDDASSWKQRTRRNNKGSSSREIITGLPQCSTLSLLFFNDVFLL